MNDAEKGIVTNPHPPSGHGFPSADAAIAGVALAASLLLLLILPWGVLDKADRLGYAVCHQIPERSFWVAGRPLPLCARCSGTYLGAMAGLAVLAARRLSRAGRLPTPAYQAIFGVFGLLWVLDGCNSLLALFPGLPHLYEPSNTLRLVTGTGMGLAVAAFLLPAWNMTVWSVPDDVPSVGNWRDLAWLLVGGAAVVASVRSEWPTLLYPLALLSGLAVVGLISSVNVVLVTMLMRREGGASNWRATVPLISAGIALALAELIAIGLVRSALEAQVGRLS